MPGMDSERQRRVEALYRAALQRDASSRDRFLEERCAGDQSLRLEVESLLRQDCSLIATRLDTEQSTDLPATRSVGTGEAGEGGLRRDADRPLFKDVVEGTVANKDELEQTVSAALAKDWTWARIDRLVRAILLAGTYELLHRKDVPSRGAITDEVEIARAFYDQGAPGFVNSVRDRVGRQARPTELAT